MATPKTVAFHTLGCKLNYSETSSISKLFSHSGFDEVDFKEQADVYVINTCSVTDFADQKCRRAIKSAVKLNPTAKVVVIGCYAQLKPKEIAAIPGVSMVLGANEKFRIMDYMDELHTGMTGCSVYAGDIKDVNVFVPSFSSENRTRSFLKVQDGCDYKCSFCTIPQARGRSRSGRVEQIVTLAKELGQSGVKEIVLTGVNIGDFGNGTEVLEGTKPKKEHLFIDLIKALEQEVTEIERFRISSIEPNLCSDEVIDFVASSKRFVPHFHLPLQSGDNDILTLMRRRYKSELYKNRVEHIKSKIPHCCIGVDVIVGFPGETEEHFQNTFDFIHGLDISYLHVFPYSERKNTPAAQMEYAVPIHVRKERGERLRILSEKKRRFFYTQHLGTKAEILVEKDMIENTMFGFTKNYIRVEIPQNEFLVNKIIPVELTSITSSGMVQGAIIQA